MKLATTLSLLLLTATLAMTGCKNSGHRATSADNELSTKEQLERSLLLQSGREYHSVCAVIRENNFVQRTPYDQAPNIKVVYHEDSLLLRLGRECIVLYPTAENPAVYQSAVSASNQRSYVRAYRATDKSGIDSVVIHGREGNGSVAIHYHPIDTPAADSAKVPA